MWNKVRTTYNISTPRDTVMRLLKEIDPEGTEQRKARKLKRRVYQSNGPNHAWHIDGYDKLKPYGLPIHGCVDGFSRKILWLKVCKSNNNPNLMASFFVNSIKEFKVAPRVVQTDCGTENGLVATIQSHLHNDAAAHRYGKSVSNQRIENWWSHQRRGYTNWIINFFKELVDEGVLSLGNNLHLNCVWFVFSSFLQKELNTVKEEWNNHFIRKSHHSLVNGIPDELYFLPETRDYEDCGLTMTEDQMQQYLEQNEIVNQVGRVENNDEESDIFEFCQLIVDHFGYEHPPRDWKCAKELLQVIINHLNR